MAEVLAYYRLMAAWLLQLVAPGRSVGEVDLPLPAPPPFAFRVVPVRNPTPPRA